MPWLLPARSKVFPRPLDWDIRFRGTCSQELRAARYSRSGQRGTGAHPALVGKAFADTQQMQVSASNKLACATHSAPQVPAMCALQGHFKCVNGSWNLQSAFKLCAVYYTNKGSPIHRVPVALSCRELALFSSCTRTQTFSVTLCLYTPRRLSVRINKMHQRASR